VDNRYAEWLKRTKPGHFGSVERRKGTFRKKDILNPISDIRNPIQMAFREAKRASRQVSLTQNSKAAFFACPERFTPK